ncbi:Esterase A [Patulibacter medicamentivorans]|uniref:Esterase A n=1 Tax=Patulibacter medicamentivorans TaxID=1097667 RepID=H0E3F2_9ACTN|nr:serine hydrolase domain-containing protein [Patulibacter medicamentivorans]EHN11804.1 Esterase A [Patulibacter medicamentivorans]
MTTKPLSDRGAGRSPASGATGAGPFAGVGGYVEPGFEAIGKLFSRTFRAAGRGGGSFVVRHRDRVLVDIWAGVADPASGQPWRRDSLGLSFSTSKGVASTVIHRLADQGLLDYDEPVATYWPEFRAGGKGAITVRQLLTHQAGLDRLRPIAPDLPALLDHVGAEQRLAARTPDHRPGRPAYHAVTYGWLLGGLARAITGRGIDELLASEVSEPLGVDGLHFGRPRAGGERVPTLVGGLGPLLGLVPAAALLPGFASPRRGLESVYAPGLAAAFTGRDAPGLDTVMPAVNGMFSAESLATLYGALANGGSVDGRQLLSPETVRRIERVESRAPDLNVVIPMIWRLGYHQAFVPGAWLPRAFGHFGYAGSGAWADPASGLSVAFVTNRIYPPHTPFGDLLLYRLSQLTVAALRRRRGPGASSAGGDGAAAPA